MSTAQGGSGQASGSAANAGGQAPPSNSSPAGQAPTQANTEHDNTLDDVPPERLRKMVEDLRKSEAAHRTEAKDLRAWKEEKERGELSDSERKDKELARHQEIAAKATTDLQRERVERAVDRIAARMGIDPDVASRLIDWSELEYEDDGKPKNATKLLEALVKDKPYLVTGTPQPAAGASQNGNGSTPSRQTAGGPTNPRSNPSSSTGDEPMSAAVYQRLMNDPAEYMRRRQEVLDWRAKQR